MSLLEIHGPGETSPDMEEIYQNFIQAAGMVPPHFLLSSTSPGIQSLQAQILDYYREGSSLSPLLQALIRYLTAIGLGMEPCVEFNAAVLAAQGLSEDQIEDLKVNPAAAPLDEREGWLCAFVIKAVRVPETVSKGHVEKLRDLGWVDRDIFDALYLSCTMVGMERMMKALKFDE